MPRVYFLMQTFLVFSCFHAGGFRHPPPSGVVAEGPFPSFSPCPSHSFFPFFCLFFGFLLFLFFMHSVLLFDARGLVALFNIFLLG